MQVQPYLSFEGRAEEAIEFYKRVLGAEVPVMMRYKDMPGTTPLGMVPPGSENKVMHATLKIGDSTVMVSDGRISGKPHFQGISLSASVKGDAEAEKMFAALSEGGQVQMPIAPAFFASRFGMVVDKFGVTWMVVTEGMPG
jgi:PhnB protein